MAAPVNCTGQIPEINLGFRRPNPRSLTTLLYTTTSSSSSMVRLDYKFQQLSTPSILRVRNALRLQVRDKKFVFASSTSGGDSSKDEMDEIKDGKNLGQNPPFLTILAGFLVVFVVVWIIKSILMSLIGLLLAFPTSK